MNVLILTPDAVGSTLLQRLITIYMQFHDFDRPVINLHELTNGLQKYFSPEFNQEIVSKRKVESWGYHQSLEQIVDILDSVRHYKTSRLAQYHIKNRNDSLEQQVPFYRYLDQNFFVIACRRDNIFEHALSMTINSITKKLNVYNHQEKIDTFVDLYLNPITLDEEVFANKLSAYQNYITWSSDHFNVGSYFYYDRDLDRIEDYILDLPIWPQNNIRITWQQKFGLSLNNWNRCHHIPSDIGGFLQSKDELYQLLGQNTDRVTSDTVRRYQHNALPQWPAVHTTDDFESLPVEIKSKFLEDSKIMPVDLAPRPVQEFMAHHTPAYRLAESAIHRMQELDILMSPPPIKKQTLQEKMSMVKNIDRCLEIYNQWIMHNPDLGSPFCRSDLDDLAMKECSFWSSVTEQDAAKLDQLSFDK